MLWRSERSILLQFMLGKEKNGRDSDRVVINRRHVLHFSSKTSCAKVLSMRLVLYVFLRTMIIPLSVTPRHGDPPLRAPTITASFPDTFLLSFS